MGWKTFLRGCVGNGMGVCAGCAGMEYKSCGMGGNGSESGWGQVVMEIKSAGMGGDGCIFCPHAVLYFRG